MAQVIIVSRTKMTGDYVCVGGVDVNNRRSVRLLNAWGHHESATDCPYQIWDIWDIDYYLNQGRPHPHTEDVNVVRRQKIDIVDAPNMSINRFAGVLESSGIPLFRGSLFTVFDGRLKMCRPTAHVSGSMINGCLAIPTAADAGSTAITTCRTATDTPSHTSARQNRLLTLRLAR